MSSSVSPVSASGRLQLPPSCFEELMHACWLPSAASGKPCHAVLPCPHIRPFSLLSFGDSPREALKLDDVYEERGSKKPKPLRNTEPRPCTRLSKQDPPAPPPPTTTARCPEATAEKASASHGRFHKATGTFMSVPTIRKEDYEILWSIVVPTIDGNYHATRKERALGIQVLRPSQLQVH